MSTAQEFEECKCYDDCVLYYYLVIEIGSRDPSG